MADKKISDLGTSTGSLGASQYIEIYDSAEALPADQNKKRSFSSLKTELGTHTQNTDTKLDEGGSNEITAAELVTLKSISGYVPFTFTYNSSVVPTGIVAGEIRLDSHTPSSVTHVFLFKSENERDVGDILEDVAVNSYVFFQSRTGEKISGVYKVSAVTDSTTYMDYTVTVVDAYGVDISASNGELCAVTFIPGLGGSGNVATDTIWDTKGDIAAATGSDTAAKLTAGSDGQIIVYASGQSTGLKKSWLPVKLGLEIGAEATDLETGTSVKTFRVPFDMTLTNVVMGVTTAPTGSTLIVDINESGSTILSTKLSIDATEKTSRTATSAVVISDSALAEDNELTFDIDQVGSTIAGQEITIWLIGYKNAIA